VLPVRYELNSYILFRRNSVFKGLKKLFSVFETVIVVAYVSKEECKERGGRRMTRQEGASTRQRTDCVKTRKNVNRVIVK
jgi:hypothetical protein